jgi:S1-C subfamily serine protease
LEFTAGRAGCAIAIAAGMIAALAMPGAAADAGGVVWCHDAARDLVIQRPANACLGRIVDENEADRIRERRRARIRRGLGGMPTAVPRSRISSSGAEFFIASDGTLVTNAHVVANCPTVIVEAAGNATGPARLLGVDTDNDLALLRTDVVPKAIADFALPRDLAVDESDFRCMAGSRSNRSWSPARCSPSRSGLAPAASASGPMSGAATPADRCSTGVAWS